MKKLFFGEKFDIACKIFSSNVYEETVNLQELEAMIKQGQKLWAKNQNWKQIDKETLFFWNVILIFGAHAWLESSSL